MKKRSNGKKPKTAANLPSSFLTEREVQVICNQIRNNSHAIDRYIETIDLLINKERCPKDANTLLYLRERLTIAVAENDTFRRVLWRHMQIVESRFPSGETFDAALFLIGQIKSRKSALMAQLARK